MDSTTLRENFKDKKRIVVKVGTSSLTHPETGLTDLITMEKLVRELTDLHNRGKEVILVSSGAIAVGRKTIGMKERPTRLSTKQACASIGQARLMMMYQKLFMEYNQVAAQILMTKNTLVNGENRMNARNTFEMLLTMGAIPIVNENDTISTYEIQFGDNDTLSAVVAALVQADLLILLSDIDGLFTDDPNKNPQAQFIEYVEHVDRHFEKMGKGSASDVGTGGMSTKLKAAKLATSAGADMVIANGADMGIIHRIVDGQRAGTVFRANRTEDFYLIDYLDEPTA
ncbi:MAG: glutamate 5-kinase [Eubacteriales bacterium]|nr:glutamate 5-kinase [Eubacteriales bacterium]